MTGYEILIQAENMAQKRDDMAYIVFFRYISGKPLTAAGRRNSHCLASYRRGSYSDARNDTL